MGRLCIIAAFLWCVVRYLVPSGSVPRNNHDNKRRRRLLDPVEQELGNELEVFWHYRNLTVNIYNEKSIFDRIYACENDASSKGGNEHYSCRRNITNEIDGLKRLWNWTEPRDRIKEVDCDYSISQVPDNPVGDMVLRITQSNCKDIYTSSYPGGSSFEVNAMTNKGVIIGCSQIDNFDSTYELRCPTKLLGSDVCITLTVILDYEHFDAFADVALSDAAMLRKPIASSQLFCKSSGPRVVSDGDKYPADIKLIAEATRSGVWHRPYDRAYVGYDGYEWYDKDFGFKYISSSGFRKCAEKKRLIIGGESHMRNSWEAYLYYHVDKQFVVSLPTKHGPAVYREKGMYIEFDWPLYAPKVMQSIENITCGDDGSGKPSVYMYQTGSWDLRFFPPRFHIIDPRALTGIARAIGNLFARPDCKKWVRLVWVQTMPHAAYSVRPSNIQNWNNPPLQVMRWRNEYSITAINMHIRSLLQALNLPDHVKIIEPMDYWLARSGLSETVCTDHLMGRGEKTDYPIEATPAGMAILNRLLYESCSDVLDMEKDTYTSGACVSAIVGGFQQIFLIQHGLRRHVPDEETLALLKFDLNTEVLRLSEATIMDIPEGPLILSRKDGVLYRGNVGRTVYMMENGLRRCFNNIKTFIAMGKDFDDVKTVMMHELLAIPEGACY